MNAPFLNQELFNLDFGLVLTVLIGMGFGFALEKAGFGSARKLAAQFYLYDMTVFKVMFTAIITAMVGLFGLVKIGFIDLDLTYINPTFLWPQIVGGLMLGVGFIISGYCPGTSLVATASGKLDGLVTVGGVILGIFIFGLTYNPALAEFHTSGSYGRLMLSDIFGVEPTLLALIITAAAIGCFFLAHWVEKQFSHLANGIAPTYVPRLRYAAFGTLVVAAVLFALPFTPYEASVEASAPSETIAPLDAAQRIVDGDRTFGIIDLRENPAEETTVPATVPVVRDEETGEILWNQFLMPHHDYAVLTSEGSVPDDLKIPAKYSVQVLEGGYEHWKETILTEPTLPENASEEEQQDFRIRSAFYAYFTGAAMEAPKVTTPLPNFKATGGKKKKPAGGC